MKIAHVSAGLNTDEKNHIRLTIEGVPIGDVYGEVLAELARVGDTNEVKVDLWNVHVDLTEADQRKVQSLAEDPDIAIVPAPLRKDTKGRAAGSSLPAGATGAEPSDHGPTWKVTLHLRDPLRLQRSGMRFTVMTPADPKDRPTLLMPDPSTEGGPGMHGKVQLQDGRVDVVGKFFDIEPDHAVVTFNGNPGNPELAVTARWDAPDGTRVYAEVSGPLKNPHVQLRSDPAKPQSEILALILFGGTDETQTQQALTEAEQRRSGAGGQGAAAAGVGSGVAAAGLNKLLEDVAPMSISTRVDTSQSQNVRPTVVVEVARNVLAEATVNTGAIPIGQNPDRYLLTLDWRFLRNWSLRTTVGDAGSSILDLIWQHRY